jgi:hypothetical protein
MLIKNTSPPKHKGGQGYLPINGDKWLQGDGINSALKVVTSFLVFQGSITGFKLARWSHIIEYLGSKALRLEKDPGIGRVQPGMFI